MPSSPTRGSPAGSAAVAMRRLYGWPCAPDNRVVGAAPTRLYRARMDKLVASARAAVADVPPGATILIGGFGVVRGWPASLLAALREHRAGDLTLIANTPGVGPTSPQILAEAGLVRKLIASYAMYPTQRTPVEAGIRAGRIELELVPQGTLIERLRAGGAGWPRSTPDRRRHRGHPRARGNASSTGGATSSRPRCAATSRSCARRAPIAAATWSIDAAPGTSTRRWRRPPGSRSPRWTTSSSRGDRSRGGGDPGISVDLMVACEHPLDAAAVRALSRRWGRKWDLEARQRADGPQGVPPDLMVRRVARLLRPGEYVNLGLGLPTLLSSALDPAQNVTLPSENGMLGFGPLAGEPASDGDVHCYNASGHLVSQHAGASYFDSTSAFAMARSGRVTTVVLGGFQVSRDGDLANVPATGLGGIRGGPGAPAGGARRPWP